MRDADDVRRTEARQHLRRQLRKLQIAAQPAFGDLQALGHPLLAAVVIALDRARVVGRPFIIGQILARSVLQVREAERLLVGEFPGFDDELEIREVMPAQPADAPMASGSTDDLEADLRVTRRTIAATS